VLLFIDVAKTILTFLVRLAEQAEQEIWAMLGLDVLRKEV